MPDKNVFTDIIIEKLALTVSTAMFLSRLPLNALIVRLTVNHNVDDEQFSFDKTAIYFGPAAIIVALPAAAVIWIATFFELPSTISAILAVITLILTTGALHEDALADVADGFGGGKSVEKKLNIMRDSQIGTFGACALLLSIALQIACIAELSTRLSITGLIFALIAANVASTTIMVWPWATQASARAEGGLSTSLGVPSIEAAKQACLIGFSLALPMLWIAVGLYAAIISLAVCWLCMMVFNRYAHNQIGGHTGDSLGATKKLSELGLLLALIVAT